MSKAAGFCYESGDLVGAIVVRADEQSEWVMLTAWGDKTEAEFETFFAENVHSWAGVVDEYEWHGLLTPSQILELFAVDITQWR